MGGLDRFLNTVGNENAIVTGWAAESSIIMNVLLSLVALASCVAAFKSAESAKESTKFVENERLKQKQRHEMMKAIFQYKVS
ncbi:hypothetical protein [Paenibacillus silvae]|uniref:Holin n=1 Tax=Paenibacillus silvae TaxID=1325358 RepID=A0A2W6QA41_9BACL|nr:hypothetical protein [Paenibacillus silvae]PZT54153.1 hypothetical protein DN757_19170 [Paenibacillus silvae]